MADAPSPQPNAVVAATEPQPRLQPLTVAATEPPWGEIQTAYTQRKCTVEALAARYGINANTLKSKAMRGGWTLTPSKLKEYAGTVATVACNAEAAKLGKLAGREAGKLANRALAKVSSLLDKVDEQEFTATDINQLRTAAETLKTIVGIGVDLGAIAQAGPTSVVNIAIMAELGGDNYNAQHHLCEIGEVPESVQLWTVGK